MCSTSGNFNIKALCVILDSPLLTPIPRCPPLFELYDNVSAYSDRNQFYFLSKVLNKTDMPLSSNSLLETGLLFFPLALFVLLIALVFTCYADFNSFLCTVLM